MAVGFDHLLLLPLSVAICSFYVYLGYVASGILADYGELLMDIIPTQNSDKDNLVLYH